MLCEWEGESAGMGVKVGQEFRETSGNLISDSDSPPSPGKGWVGCVVFQVTWDPQGSWVAGTGAWGKLWIDKGDVPQ